MMKFLLPALLALAAGCGPKSSDDLAKRQVALVNDLADALEKGTPLDKLEGFKKESRELRDQFEALKLTDADKKDLEAKHKADYAKAFARLFQAAAKANVDRGKVNDIIYR